MVFVKYDKNTKRVDSFIRDVLQQGVIYKSAVSGVNIELFVFGDGYQKALIQVADPLDYCFFPDNTDLQVGEILTDEKLAQALPKVEAMTHEEIVQKLADLQAQINALRGV